MDEYIPRQAAISALLHESIVMSNGNCIIPQVFGINRILEIPPADVRPVVRSEWVFNDNRTWHCKRCKSWIPDEQRYYANWCLFCGADMRGDTDG